MAAPLVEWQRILRAGDRVLWGSGAAEPPTLVRDLIDQQRTLPELSLHSGMLIDDDVTPARLVRHRMRGFGAQGGLAAFSKAGRLDVVPCRISSVPTLLRSGAVPVDVLLLHVSPPDDDGNCSTGVTSDYLLAAADVARIIVAEVNEAMPFTFGDTLIHESRFEARIHVDRPLAGLDPAPSNEIERRIAEHVATLVEDGATIEVGFGSTATAICEALATHTDLGIHSGLISDPILDLIEAGVVTNACKSIDKGVNVSTILMGTDRLYRWANRNPSLAMRTSEHVHDVGVIRTIDRFCAINSALQVDLLGQVNSEAAGSTLVGGVGGLCDFVLGALMAPRGRSIIALPSTARGGSVSRIVPTRELNLVTVPHCDADYVVTEWGIARLRGRSFGERRDELIAIADPQFRDALSDENAFPSATEGALP